MSLNSEEIKQHCKFILKSPRIRNKVVILCEGAIPKPEGRLSPQAYRKMEKMPDSNFYNACIPDWWRERRPQFFNCGSRNDVIRAYFYLSSYQDSSASSFLDSNKLFTLIDLDIQIQKINNDYLFSNTEEIYYDLYNKYSVREENIKKHRIWVTGLIHKEAYFILPEINSVFHDFSNNSAAPLYNGSNLSLDNVYLDIGKEISLDQDLKSNYETAHKRISHCKYLSLRCIEDLEHSWQAAFSSAANTIVKDELVNALLTVRKAKEYWEKIYPSSEWTGSPNTFKDQLVLEIGKFYSRQSDTSRYHIPAFFKTLYQLTQDSFANPE